MMICLEQKSLLLPYNLQLFADGPGGERTEKATPRRKEKAREEGQVAKSNEITTSLFFVIMFSTIKVLGPSAIADLTQFINDMYALLTIEEFDMPLAASLVGYSFRTMLKILTPILLTSFLLAFACNFMQVGWHPTGKTIVPKFSKLNPISGFKRLFSLRAGVELIKSILKIAIILAIVYFSIRDYDKVILMIYDLPVLEAYALVTNICLDVAIKVGGFFAIVALLDYIYQRYDLSKNIKMTKQEIKDEYKQTEGNPEIKSRIRQKMREASMRRMMQNLPKADVIITNPTHFAVAIGYNANEHKAPVVLAKGADLIAAKIREVGKQNHIEIVENKSLARTLYYTVDIDSEIPPELYQAVAEILALVYQINNGQKLKASVQL